MGHEHTPVRAPARPAPPALYLLAPCPSKRSAQPSVPGLFVGVAARHPLPAAQAKQALVGPSPTPYKTPVTPQRLARSSLPSWPRMGRDGNAAQDAEAFCRGLPAGARLLGIDVGSKTLGLALSDVTRTIASGLLTLKRGKFSADVAQLRTLIEAHQVGGLVVGLPPTCTAAMVRVRNQRAPSCAT